jgi:O-antigen/teichoic acid export membrane protein
MLKNFLRDTAIYAIPSFISRGLGFILIPLYTRVLAPADYGTLDLLTVFGSLVSLTVALEISQGVARYYTGENNPNTKIEYASTAFWFAVFCYTLFVIAAFTFSKELSAMVIGRQGMEMYFRLASVYIGLNGVFYLIQSQFRWELRSKNFAAASIIVSLITAGLAILFTYVFGWGLAGVLSGMASGVLAGCVYGLWNLGYTFQFRFHWMRLKEMLSFSAPLVPSGIAVFVNNYIDRVMINHYLSLNEVGLYGIGFRLAGVIGRVERERERV